MPVLLQGVRRGPRCRAREHLQSRLLHQRATALLCVFTFQDFLHGRFAKLCDAGCSLESSDSGRSLQLDVLEFSVFRYNLQHHITADVLLQLMQHLEYLGHVDAHAD